jgi:putative nucleotidyltransferase with HDIG domain
MHSATLDLSTLHGTFAGRVLQQLRTYAVSPVLVGGSVRDLLLGRELHDLDLAVPAGALDLARRLANAMQGAYVPLDEGRDVGRALLKGPDGRVLVVDIAAWRGPSLAADLAARDFTLNALAAELHGDEAAIIDVTGGLADLERRLVRTTSERALSDDPLRCLRGLRLVAELSPWGMRLEQNTAQQIHLHAPRLHHSAAERVRDELVRILAAPQPQHWLPLLSELGLLAETLPEAEALHGVTQTAPHIWDVFDHTAVVLGHVAWLVDWIAGRSHPADALDAVASQMLAPFRSALAAHLAQPVGAALGSRGAALRWAALCHDWGKPATRQQVDDPADGPARVRFLGHEDVGAELAASALRRLHCSEAEVRWIVAITAGHMRPHHLVAVDQISRRAIFRYFRSLDVAGVDTALLSLADLRGAAGPGLPLADWQRQLEMVVTLIDAYFSRPLEAIRPPRLLDGHELISALALRPGPLVGQLLEAVAEAQAAGELHHRDQALAYARQLAASAGRLPQGHGADGQ